MANEYGLSNTEEKFKALIDELLNKVPDKAQQADARQALSKIIGVDIDKLAALINDNATEQTNEQAEQEEPESILADDMFTAQDPNELRSIYRASELPFGTVITIEGVESLHTLIDHGDHVHSPWVNIKVELFDDEAVA